MNGNVDVNLVLDEYNLRVTELTKEIVLQKAFIKQMDARIKELEAELTEKKININN